MDKVTELKPIVQNDLSGSGPEMRTAPRPCDALALSEDDIAAVMKDIETINKRLERPVGRPGMVFDRVLAWETTKEDGEKVRVAIKKPRSVSAEKIERDVSNLQQRLIESGEYRFAPTYRLPGTELIVQRLIEQRLEEKDELHEFWENITTRDKSFSVSQLGDNVLIDKRYGPIIIDVFNVHFDNR